MEVDTRTCKTAEYFKTFYKYIYLIGWPNFWYTSQELPAIFIKYHNFTSIFFSVSVWSFIIIELAGIFTQNDLSDKQKADQQLFCISHPILTSYGYILTFNQKNVRNLTYSLAVELKKTYNDIDIEREMLKKAQRNSIALCFLISSALVFYGLDGLHKCLFDKDATFITVITAWPDVNDHSTPAISFRILAYILWWMFVIRMSGILVMLISTIVCLGHQYKNLQSYFYNLDHIFEDNALSQNEKEEKYEKGLKLGINMHARTLWCTRECEQSFKVVVSGQILVNITVIILLMSQMLTSDRTFSSIAAILSTMSAMLISTGYIMWNAGDVAIEAEALTTAMFSSGWYNCQGKASARVRKLLVIAMTQAQIPVSIHAFGIIPMSYGSYVSIVKSSYSVFSVLY